MPAESGSRLSARCSAAAVRVNILPDLQTAEIVCSSNVDNRGRRFHFVLLTLVI